MGPSLTPEWLELEESFGMRPCLRGSPDDIRQQHEELAAIIRTLVPPINEDVETRDGVLSGGVRYRVYMPIKPAAKDPLPLALFTHGGGFVSGGLAAEDWGCRLVAQETPCVLISVAYRLAPEHKLPVMLEDTMLVLDWALENATSVGADASRLFTMGISSGAALALAVANQFAADKNHQSPVRGVVAVNPWTLHPENVPNEYRTMYKSYEENGTDSPIIDSHVMQVFYEAVNANPQDSSIFTALSPHLPRFPPTYIATCGADPVRDDGVILEHGLRKAGVQTRRDHYEQLPHAFWVFPQIDMRQVFLENLITGMQWIVSTMG